MGTELISLRKAKIYNDIMQLPNKIVELTGGSSAFLLKVRWPGQLTIGVGVPCPKKTSFDLGCTGFDASQFLPGCLRRPQIWRGLAWLLSGRGGPLVAATLLVAVKIATAFI